MKNNLLITFVFLAVIFGCAAASSAQVKVGGYKPAAVDDATVKEAAEFAVTAQNKVEDGEMSLVAIESAQRQVVAGSNYKLCLKVNIPGTDETVTDYYQAIVFYSLKREFKLTKWATSDDCGASE